MKVTINDNDGIAPTILAGYYKFGSATLIGGGYGVSGASVMIVYENDIRMDER